MSDYVVEMRFTGITEASAYLIEQELQKRWSPILGCEVKVHSCNEPVVRWESSIADDKASSKQLYFAKTLLKDVALLASKPQVQRVAQSEVEQAKGLVATVEYLLADSCITKQRVSSIITALKDARADLFFFDTGMVYSDGS